jgi:biopolymer transport protein ExbD
MKFSKRLSIEKGALDLTPLVNVFFLLLIFFMFTSSFIFQPGIKVELPKAVTSEILQQETATVIITSDDKIYLDDRQISLDELNSKLNMIAKQKIGLLVKADARASHGRIVEVWDMCRNQGVSHVNIATSQ